MDADKQLFHARFPPVRADKHDAALSKGKPPSVTSADADLRAFCKLLQTFLQPIKE